MFNRLFITVAAFLIMNVPSYCLADAAKAGENAQKQMEKTASEVFGKIGGKVTSIRQSPVDGLYEVLIEKDGKTGIVYLDQAGKHLMQGMVLDVESLRPVFAHPEEMLQPKQKTSLDVKAIPVQHAVVMGNPSGAKKLYVFTDPDCPYCHRMHTELKKLSKMAPDIAIHIMLMPLPMHPQAYDKSRTIIETRSIELLDKAFSGKEVPKPSKENSKAAVDEIIRFAGENGINGTPTLVLGNGSIIVGMRDAEMLKKMLE